jgi:hypothetical protein
MSVELISLPPLPDLVDDEPAPRPPSPDDDADPIAAMRSNLRFFVSSGRAILEALATLDPAQAEERQAFTKQYLICVVRSQQIAADLAPYCAPKMANTVYTPPPKPAEEGSLADAITPGMSGIDASIVYQKLIHGL